MTTGADTAEFRLLGPVELRVAGRSLDLGPRRQRTVLTALLVDAGRMVPVEVLIDRVWGDAVPSQARNLVYSYLTRIRRAMNAVPGGLGQRLVHRSGGYLFDVDPQWVDLHRFRSLLQQSREPAGHDEQRAAAIEAALALWRGTPLAGLSGIWPERTREGLQQQRLDALVVWGQTVLRLGHHEVLIERLPDLVAEHPLVEPLVATLMRALHSAGRSAEALDRFARTRRWLIEELGVEPGESLQRLHEQILKTDDRLGKPDRLEPSAAARQLPPPPSVMVGRAVELAVIRKAATGRAGPSARTVAIHGPAGVGKSAVASAVAQALADLYPDGQLFVDLRGAAGGAGQASVAAALAWLLRGLGMPASDIPTDPAQAAALFRASTATLRVLILLDNAASADQVRPLAEAGPGCLVLVTSRRLLVELDTAVHFGLGPLAPAAARDLIARVIGTRRVAAEAAAAAAVARYCEHLPLALRIVGARLARRPDYPLAQMAQRLGDVRHRLDALELDAVGVRSSLRESYHALQQDEDAGEDLAARAFRLAGSLALPLLRVADIAGALDRPIAETETVVDRMVDLRLLEPVGPDGLRMHDLVRLFAVEQAERVEGDDIRWQAIHRVYQRHLQQAQQAINQVRPHQTRPPDTAESAPDDAAAASAWLEAELPTLSAIVRHGAAEPEHLGALAIMLTLQLTQYLPARGNWAGLAELAGLALTAATHLGDRRGQALAMTMDALSDQRTGNYPRALRTLDRVMELRLEIGDHAAVGVTFDHLALAYTQTGDTIAAFACLARALRIHRQMNRAGQAATTMHNLAVTYERLGRIAAADRFLRRSLALRWQVGDRVGEACTLVVLGRVLAASGRLTEALGPLGEGIERSHAVRYVEAECEGLLTRGEIYRRLGDGNDDNARTDADQAHTSSTTAQDRYFMALSRALRDRVDGVAPTANEVLAGYRGPRNASLEAFLFS